MRLGNIYLKIAVAKNSWIKLYTMGQFLTKYTLQWTPFAWVSATENVTVLGS